MGKKRGMNDSLTIEEEAIIEAQVPQETPEPDQDEATAQPVLVEEEREDPDYTNLLGILQGIRRNPYVHGYILKGDTKATVDLNDQAKIMEYAMLSSQAFESAETLAATFKLGAPENIVIEGKDLKVLCVDMGQNRISLFMEKGTDHAEFLEAFTPKTE